MKQIIDFAMAIFGCFSTVAQSLVATCLGKVRLQPKLPYVCWRLLGRRLVYCDVLVAPVPIVFTRLEA